MDSKKSKRSAARALRNLPILWLPFEFLKWVAIDKLETDPSVLRVSGMDLITGPTGSGKTLSLCDSALRWRIKYNDQVAIATNFFWEGQDFALQSYSQISREYVDSRKDTRGKPLIVFIDEAQKSFHSTEFNEFPKTLRDNIAEARKLNIRIEASTQYERFANNVLREYCHTISIASNIFHKNRLIKVTTYTKDDYERKEQTKLNQYPPRIDPIKVKYFVASDYIYNMYDTFRTTESIKKLEYDGEEIYLPPQVQLPVQVFIDPKKK